MSTTATESRNEHDVRQEIQDLKKSMEVQAATEAACHAAATHAGTWSTMLAGAAGLVVGMFLALAIDGVPPLDASYP